MSNDIYSLSGQTACVTKAGLAEGTNSGTIKTAAPNGAGTDYAIGGVAYHKADTDNIALTAAAIQADGTTCLYMVNIDSSGTVSSVKGEAKTSTDLSGGNAALQWPAVPEDVCPLGGIVVTCDGATFTAGTTDLGSVNAEYIDFALGIPSAPRLAIVEGGV